MNNFQRNGSISNSQVGINFERLVFDYFFNNEIRLEKNKVVNIGLHSQKEHTFDLGNEDIIVECKSHKWTESQKVPSGKIRNWNEAMFLFYLSPKRYKKYFVVENDYNQRRTQSLLEYYIDKYYHLIPEDVVLFDFYIESKFCDIYEYDHKIMKHIKRNV